MEKASYKEKVEPKYPKKQRITAKREWEGRNIYDFEVLEVVVLEVDTQLCDLLSSNFCWNKFEVSFCHL